MKPLNIAIAGAGLLGRLLAWQLSNAGHKIQVFDIARDEKPIPRSLAGENYPINPVPTAAAFTAAGMLSPISELDNAEPKIAALGWRSIVLWKEIAKKLGKPELVFGDKSLLLAHQGDIGSAMRVINRIKAAEKSEDWKSQSPANNFYEISPEQLKKLEPSIHEVAHAWALTGEACIDTVQTMQQLYKASPKVKWNWGVQVEKITSGEIQINVEQKGGQKQKFDLVIDVRGVGANTISNEKIRGVRGEVIWVQLAGHGLTSPVRLLHPRHRVYIVPRSPQDILIGASEIESNDRSPVSLRTAVELMAAAHSIMPILAEARIIKMDVNLRPALPDNNPVILWEENKLSINGLFRHGWLLAPALIEKALGERFNLTTK